MPIQCVAKLGRCLVAPRMTEQGSPWVPYVFARIPAGISERCRMCSLPGKAAASNRVGIFFQHSAFLGLGASKERFRR